MKTLAIQTKHLHAISPGTAEETSSDDLSEQFPSPRYFQVHFEHMHDTTNALRQEISQLKQANAALEAKVDALMQMLTTLAK